MSKKIEFSLPAGWTAPEGKKEGDYIECVCEIELKANGRACLSELDEVPMPGYGDDEEKSSYKPGMEQPPGGNGTMYSQPGGGY